MTPVGGVLLIPNFQVGKLSLRELIRLAAGEWLELGFFQFSKGEGTKRCRGSSVFLWMLLPWEYHHGENRWLSPKQR